MRYKVLLILTLALFSGCAMQPEGLVTVATLDTQRYMGTWHEIARLDHSFERGLEQVSAEYTLNSNGTIGVTNRGYNPDKKAWKEAHGIARFREEIPNGKIKVSFFGPFYGGYNIVELDPGYRHVLIIGPDTSYAWILARDPQLDPATYRQLVDKAASLGVPATAWIKVRQ